MNRKASDELTPKERERAIRHLFGRSLDSWTACRVREALQEGRDAVPVCRKGIGVGSGLYLDGFEIDHDSRGVRVKTGDGRTGSISYREIVAYVKRGGTAAV